MRRFVTRNRELAARVVTHGETAVRRGSHPEYIFGQFLEGDSKAKLHNSRLSGPCEPTEGAGRRVAVGGIHVPPLGMVEGVEHLARNSMLNFSAGRKFFLREMSQLLRPGPRTITWPALPFYILRWSGKQAGVEVARDSPFSTRQIRVA